MFHLEKSTGISSRSEGGATIYLSFDCFLILTRVQNIRFGDIFSITSSIISSVIFLFFFVMKLALGRVYLFDSEPISEKKSDSSSEYIRFWDIFSIIFSIISSFFVFVFCIEVSVRASIFSILSRFSKNYF